jgi:type I restriction enzyme S subunit
VQTVACTNQGCKSLIPNAATDAKFYGYLLSVSSTELNVRGKGTTFLELSGDELGAFKVPMPPLSEQKIIGAFLDHETAKIDWFIAKQERLNRTAQGKAAGGDLPCRHQGLNPDAPMKDSGVEWWGGAGALERHATSAHRGSNTANHVRNRVAWPKR